MTAYKSAESTVELEIISLSLEGLGSCQTLAIKLVKPQTLITPDVVTSLALPAELDFSQPLVLFGQAPIWLYSYLISQCLAKTIPWIGCYDAPGQRVVVVISQHPTISVGDAFAVPLNRDPCPAILVGGPPNSGKSVFSNALRVALRKRHPDKLIYLHRASWDGEGNWAYEAKNTDLIKRLITLNEYRIHEDPETAKLIPGYFQYHARTAGNLRKLADCLIVDVGGIPQVEKQPLVEQCSHYIVISRLAEAVDPWHQLCNPVIAPVAVVHSVLDAIQKIVCEDPLEIVAGPWMNADSAVLPEVILKRTDNLLIGI